MKSAADQTLDDLRERLLDKKRQKETSEDYGKHHDKESRRRARAEHLENLSRENVASLEQDAEMYVKEIIDLSGNADDSTSVNKERSRKERHHKREDKEKTDSEQVERKLTEAECEEQELRKEKLLQAGIVEFMIVI